MGMQYFADRDIFCAGRVAEDDLQRVASATGAQVQTTVNNLVPEVLGACDNFEERQVGSERFNIFTGCPQAKTATIILRGGAEQVCCQCQQGQRQGSLWQEPCWSVVELLRCRGTSPAPVHLVARSGLQSGSLHSL
jgi:hypothetical protein